MSQEQSVSDARNLLLMNQIREMVKDEEMARLENQLKSSEAEAEKMKAEIKNKEMEAGKMAGENDTLKKQIEKSREDLAASAKRHRETNASLGNCRRALETATREKEVLEKTQKEQSLKLTAYSTFSEKYKTEMQSKDAELEAYKMRLDRTQQCFTAKEQKCAEFATDLRKCNSDLEGLKKRHSELSRENATLKDQNKSSLVKIRQMKQKMVEFEAKIAGFNEEKKREVDRRGALMKELQTNLAKCMILLPQLEPSEPRKRSLPEPQFKPEPTAILAMRSEGSEKKKCRRTKSVVSEAESSHSYSLRKRTAPKCVSCEENTTGPEEKKCRRAQSMACA
ncbi:hypothetical protein Ddc_10173 [Ditylenchus destructor]|nr:hypothetical protein Ddc_10173 [Ditylenchus destructor]